MTTELQTLEEIAPVTPYTYQSLCYMRSRNSNFPKPKAKKFVTTKHAQTYSVSEVIEWTTAYKAAPRGKKGAVVVESVGVFGIDNTKVRAFICRPLVTVWRMYDTAWCLHQ
jgi:hypothetical protein